MASCRCKDFPFSLLKVPQQRLGFGSVVFCKVLDLTCHFNSMTGYEIPCYSFDMLDPAFCVACKILEFLLKLPYSGIVACISQLQGLSCELQLNLKTGAR